MAGKKGVTGRKKDPERTAHTRETILNAAYALFTKKNIESVSMQEIADAAGCGVATAYRYFGTKPDLVVAVAGRKWREVLDAVPADEQPNEGDGKTAAQAYARFLDSFLALYRKDKEILRFNQFFNLYIRSARLNAATLAPYSLTAGVLQERFGRIYAKALRDGTLRTDVPEDEMFSATLHLMLAAVTRYAVGLVYLPEGEPGAERELLTLKHALLLEYGAR